MHGPHFTTRQIIQSGAQEKRTMNRFQKGKKNNLMQKDEFKQCL